MSAKNWYPRVYQPDHPRAVQGNVKKHLLVVEKALGRFLPEGAEVHHVDGDRDNSANTNLVICQDTAYHKLLHVRARIVKAGGNPNTQKLCGRCARVKSIEEFNILRSNKSTGRGSVCQQCKAVLNHLYRQAH